MLPSSIAINVDCSNEGESVSDLMIDDCGEVLEDDEGIGGMRVLRDLQT